jgi:hypothetical protein
MYGLGESASAEKALMARFLSADRSLFRTAIRASISRLARLGIHCEVREIFNHQTVAELVSAIDARSPGRPE